VGSELQREHLGELDDRSLARRVRACRSIATSPKIEAMLMILPRPAATISSP
jgi:hypothetical protein